MSTESKASTAKAKHHITFDEAALEKFSDVQLESILSKTIAEKGGNLTIVSLMRSALRSVIRSPIRTQDQ